MYHIFIFLTFINICVYVDIIEYLVLLKERKDYSSLHYMIIKFEGNFIFNEV